MIAHLIADFANSSKLETIYTVEGTFHDIGMLAQDLICELDYSYKKNVYCFRLEDRQGNLLGYFRPVNNLQGNRQFAFFFE